MQDPNVTLSTRICSGNGTIRRPMRSMRRLQTSEEKVMEVLEYVSGAVDRIWRR